MGLSLIKTVAGRCFFFCTPRQLLLCMRWSFLMESLFVFFYFIILTSSQTKILACFLSL